MEAGGLRTVLCLRGTEAHAEAGPLMLMMVRRANMRLSIAAGGRIRKAPATHRRHPCVTACRVSREGRPLGRVSKDGPRAWRSSFEARQRWLAPQDDVTTPNFGNTPGAAASAARARGPSAATCPPRP